MANKIAIPFNDVFFYGISLRSRDASDVKSDIFANILMKYLMSLKPVSNKLYRVTDNAKYEYSYTFVPSKPLSWRVIKNRRVIEDIEPLSDGKYCLNYYDDHGNDVKRIIFNARNRWVKTNYYNTIYGDNLLCSLVPKEQNGETVILQYNTGVTYPVTLRCCSVASCAQVLQSVLARVPEPEVMALTNYGLLYFACEETRNIFEQILKEEEEKYAQSHKPAVYNTEEDVANGFCFQVDNFDSTKNSDSFFDLSMAEELTEDGFSDLPSESNDVQQNQEQLEITPEHRELDVDLSESPDDGTYSIDEQIAAAIKLISETTSINIDENLVFTNDSPESVECEAESEKESGFAQEIYDSIEIKEESEVFEQPDDMIIPADEDLVISEQNSGDRITTSDAYDAADLLSMDDDAIDDYVSTLIDSLLLDAHSTAADYLIAKDEVFVFADAETSTSDNICDCNSSQSLVEENTPDVTVESNGVAYFYYGETDEKGNRTGRGKTLMSDGKTAYEGYYLEDARHGKGAFYYKDGNLCYWGDWRNNLRYGFGLGISSETGVVHVGNWNNNKPEGVGVRFDSNGKFMYIDSACERTNGGIRITDFTKDTFTIEIWDENTLKVIKKVISVDDLLK